MSLERTLPPRETTAPAGGGFGTIFDGDPSAAAPANVNVSSGLYAQSLPVAGSSIGAIRTRFTVNLNIPSASQAYLDGQAVDDTVVVRAGQSLIFTQKAGERGRH